MSLNSNLSTSAAGRDFIKRWEGFSARRYLCPAGKPTIGYGHVILPHEKDALWDAVITETQADAILREDLAFFEDVVDAAVRVPLSQGQFDALVSLVFNVGPGSDLRSGIVRLANGQPSTLLKLLNSGDYKGASKQILAWNYCNGKPNAGLSNRRAGERAMFDGPQPSTVGVKK